MYINRALGPVELGQSPDNGVLWLYSHWFVVDFKDHLCPQNYPAFYLDTSDIKIDLNKPFVYKAYSLHSMVHEIGHRVHKSHPVVTPNRNHRMYRASSSEASSLELGQMLKLWLHSAPPSFHFPCLTIEWSQNALHPKQLELKQK